MKTKLIKTASGMEVRSAKEILMRHTELGAGCKVEYNITEKHILTAMEEYASQFKPTLLTEDKEGEGQGDGWVSVDERLPEKAFKDVLVYSRLGIVGLGFYDSEFLRMNSNQSHIGNITHWMPLPKPPIK